LNEMIEYIEKLTGKKANPRFGKKVAADMDVTWADISKAKRLLNWIPQVSFEEGFKRLVNWHQERS
ncbi:MAG: nucleotide sugar epimerase, partial [Bacteriovoracaceae bacterium]